MCLPPCTHTVRIIARKLGWLEVGDDESWDVYWTDTSVSLERIMRLQPTQRINHFHGMLVSVAAARGLAVTSGIT